MTIDTYRSLCRGASWGTVLASALALYAGHPLLTLGGLCVALFVSTSPRVTVERVTTPEAP